MTTIVNGVTQLNDKMIDQIEIRIAACVPDVDVPICEDDAFDRFWSWYHETFDAADIADNNAILRSKSTSSDDEIDVMFDDFLYRTTLLIHQTTLDTVLVMTL